MSEREDGSGEIEKEEAVRIRERVRGGRRLEIPM